MSLMSDVIAFSIGIITLWLLSKWYCFKNKKEWNKFKKQYNKRK